MASAFASFWREDWRRVSIQGRSMGWGKAVRAAAVSCSRTRRASPTMPTSIVRLRPSSSRWISTWMILWNDTASLGGGVEGNAGEFDEGLECSRGIGPQNTAAGLDEGAFGLLQERYGFLDQLRIPRGSRLLRQIAWEVHLIEFYLGIQNIPRQIEIDRTLLALRGHTDGLTDQLWNTPGVSNALRPLGDGLEDGDLVHLLKRSPAVLGQWARTTQGNDWRGIEESIADAGE